MAELFEIMMIVSFGASWPLNVIKSYNRRFIGSTSEAPRT